ncbi:hypothetical protein [Ferrimonas marina]|uniref:hypothetical protein n=1 Tax=Ferrimonas marina TaxID=299255 RepID=UPI001160EAB8|nr:hypothetical protein [Ferrimonas marina]
MKKVLEDGVLEEGLLGAMKPELKPMQPHLDDAKSALRQELAETGILPEDPTEALPLFLDQLVAALLQAPKSQARYLLSELANLVPELLSLHPRLGGLIGLARAMGVDLPSRGHQQRATAASLNTLLGGNAWSRAMANGGQALLSSQQARRLDQDNARSYESLTELQRQAVDLATLIKTQLASEQEAQAIRLACQQLSEVLAQPELAEGLLPQYQQALDQLVCQGVPVWPESSDQ